jgi:2-(1,2-epoxy-1,2-dihydrophenyl)acetyl-CoA isomerase
MPEHVSYAQIIADAANDAREFVTVERAGASAVVTLNDPARLNVLSAALTVQLRRQLEALAADPGIRAVVLTGAGRAFCAGGDLRMMQEVVDGLGSEDDADGAFKPYQWIRYQFGALVRLLARSDTAFIAAVNGAAAGVGLALALTCDVAVASTDAVLVPAFGQLGLVPEVGSSWALTRALGYRGAFAFFVGGEHVAAEDAARMGLLTEVVAVESLLPRAMEWADRVSGLPSHALAVGKPLLRNAADASWEQSLVLEEFAEPLCFTTGAFAAGVAEVSSQTGRRGTSPSP